MTLPALNGDQRWIERRIRGKHCPNWITHWRIDRPGVDWRVLEPGQLEGYSSPAMYFETFEEARQHVAEKVTEWMHSLPTYGFKYRPHVRLEEAHVPLPQPRGFIDLMFSEPGPQYNPLLDQSRWALMGDLGEQRLRPVSEVLRDVLNDANLSIESPFLDPEQCPNDDIRCSCPVGRGHRA